MDPVEEDFDSSSYIPWTFIPTPRNSIIKKQRIANLPILMYI